MVMDAIVGVTVRESLPTDLVAADAMILAERAARVEAEAVSEAQAEAASAKAEAANAQADLSSTEAFISHLKLEIEKLRRQLYGPRSERKARLLEQMELKLEELEAAATVGPTSVRAHLGRSVAHVSPPDRSDQNTLRRERRFRRSVLAQRALRKLTRSVWSRGERPILKRLL